MLERDHIRDAVFRAIDQLKKVSLDETTLPSDESAVLLGEGAGLDSMGFVNFVVALEEEMSLVIDRPLNLVESLNSLDVETESISTVREFIDFIYNLAQS